MHTLYINKCVLFSVAYCKAKAAVVAYKANAFREYKELSRQARLYMVLSVGLTMMCILICVVAVVLVEESQAPEADELPTRDDQVDLIDA